jgi:hypothetical protein
MLSSLSVKFKAEAAIYPYRDNMQEQSSINLKNKRKPQSGNAAWKASRRKAQLLPGRINRRICNAIARHSGKPCNQLAMSGVPVCRWHGGDMMQARIRSLQAKRNGR